MARATTQLQLDIAVARPSHGLSQTVCWQLSNSAHCHKKLNGCYPWVWVSVQWVPTFLNPRPYPCGFHTAYISYPQMKPTGTQALLNPQVPVGFNCHVALHPCTNMSFMHM